MLLVLRVLLLVVEVVVELVVEVSKTERKARRWDTVGMNTVRMCRDTAIW